jgi:Negative regulator of sigma F
MRDRSADFERRLEEWAVSEQAEFRLEVQGRLRDMLTASLAPVKPLPSQGRLVGSFLLMFAACAAGLMAILDKSGFHMMTAVQMAGMAVLLACGGVLFSIELAGRMVPGSRIVLPVPLTLALSFLAVAGGMALLFPWQASHGFVSEGWPCAALELAIAVPMVAIFWVLARRGALFRSAGLGAALTGLAVFVALTAVQFQCMFPQAAHLLVWHGGTTAILVGVGWLLGRAGLRKPRLR